MVASPSSCSSRVIVRWLASPVVISTRWLVTRYSVALINAYARPSRSEATAAGTAANTHCPAALTQDEHRSRPLNVTRERRKIDVLLWFLQALLVLSFLFTGSTKLLMPSDMLAAQTPLPVEFVRFLGVCEAAGALGLVMPSLLRIRPGLTPLAAAGLVVLMIGATVLTPVLIAPDVVLTMLPLTVGVLAGFVAYGRWRLAPLQRARQPHPDRA
jgi:uncharacterized membrane protein YphA (DoxX/SURF4 family)